MLSAARDDEDHDEEDHGCGDVGLSGIALYEASGAGHASEGSLDQPVARQHRKALLIVEPANGLDRELAIGLYSVCSVHLNSHARLLSGAPAGFMPLRKAVG